MTDNDYDLNDAQPANFDTIPNKTLAPIIIRTLAGDVGTPGQMFQVSKSGLYQLVLECTVTDGPFAKRKFWHRLTMGAQPGVTLTEGQQKGVEISKSTLRAIVEQVRGVSPTDESVAAQKARKLNLQELDGMELTVEIAIEKGQNGYSDKNKIGRVPPASKAGVGQPAAAPVAQKKTAWA